MDHSLIDYAAPPILPVGIGPWPMVGTCMSHMPDNHTIKVLLRSGQMLDVTVGTSGPNDGVRVRQDPLPTIGTDGILLFPHGDIRNGVWAHSIARTSADAYTTAPGSPHTSYQSDWSGGWRLRDDTGNYAEVYPDGTSLVVGNAGLVPATYRHVVVPAPGGGQVRARAAFTAAQRIPAPPAAMPVVVTHRTGTVLSIGVDGAITASVPTGASLVISAAGIVTVTAPSAIQVTAPAVAFSGSLHVAGDVIAGYGVANVSSLNHDHGGVQTGSGVTGGPQG